MVRASVPKQKEALAGKQAARAIAAFLGSAENYAAIGAAKC